ncbi:UbiA family prenyltransferase [Halomicrobium salinisoli]|uniref:UbiA family prenyltransferase n=1 Tax=Halomicrobium salinisoli TaxID=2878391 RepID=UPI001CF021C8|nr:UbiA family prenyltransferase [Halomicrobium salinisoli]
MTGYGGDEQSDRWFVRRLVTVARLVRLPNLFTAPPDVVLGAAIAASLGRSVPVLSLVGLSAASVLLYASGTALNDYFDAPTDGEERPERPIPSGAISRSRALLLGSSLLLGGVSVAFLAGGARAGVVSTGLALLVVGYDGGLKGSVPGYLAMGGARGTNVLLGTTVALRPTELPADVASIPVLVALYIAAVTYMADGETETGGRGAVGVAVAGAVLAAAGVVGASVVTSPLSLGSLASVAFLVAFLAWIGRPLSAAFADPAPGTIGPAVGACVLGLIPLNAAFAATASPVWALCVAAFFLPALGLAEAFDVS